MAQNRETRLTLSGLVTQPNKFLAEPGSLAVAENVMCRQPGVIEPRMAFEEIADPATAGASSLPRKIDVLSNGDVLVSLDPTGDTAATQTQRVDPDGIVTFVVTEDDSFFSTRGAFAEARDRAFVDQPTQGDRAERVRAIDPSDLALARRAGLMPPSIVEVGLGTPGNAILVSRWAGWRAHFERQHEDGYIQIGPVSPITVALNGNGFAVRADITVRWVKGLATEVESEGFVKTGDLLRVYRTDNATSQNEVGDTLRLTASIELTSTDITNGNATLLDVTADEGLGDFLYTNSGQGGSDESKWFPPSASDMVQFRDVMWYVTPYALTVFSLRVPGVWGATVTQEARASSVGAFTVTGDTTDTSAVITNISADDMVGLSIGQRLYSLTSGAFTPGAFIIAIGVSSVTLSTFASSSDVGVFFVFIDMIYINAHGLGGTANLYEAASPGQLAHSMAVGTPANIFKDQAWLFFNRPITYTPGSVLEDSVAGIEVTFIAPSFAEGRRFDIAASNGDRYSPPLPALLTGTPVELGSDDPRKNRGHFSEIDEPEAVPILNYRFFGHGTLLKLIAVEDVLLAFCSDGTYVCTGDGENWDIRDLDRALKLLHRNAVDVLEGTVWALTNRGVVAISGGQVQEVSTPFIGDRIRELEEQFAASFEPVAEGLCLYNVILKCDPTHKEVWVRWRDDTGDGVTLVFNVVTKTWTEISDVTESPTALGYDPARRSILIGMEKPQGSSIQTLRSSLPDTSPAPSSRMEAPSVQLNPFSDGDLNTKKQFVEVVYDLELAEGELEILPNFGELEYPAAYDVIGTGDDMEHVVKVPRNAANGKSLAPGFSITGTADLATAPVWRLSGVTVKFRVASPDTRRQ